MSVLRPSSVRYLNDQAVPMRDGIRLSADVYLPDEGDGPWPVLLARTPYDNNLLWEVGCFWAQNGYVYVAQDVRGRYDSDGDFVPWDNETDDGYDTLEWIGQQPWCDGNVGMTGGSYLGQVQWQAAFTQHPLLKAICPRVMGNNLWDSPHYQGGAFGLGVNAVWGWRTMARTTQRIDKFDWPAMLRTLPLRLMDKVTGKQHPAFCDLARPRRLRRLLARDRRRRALRAVHDPGPAGLRLVRPLRRRDDGQLRRAARARRERTRPREPADHHGTVDPPAGRLDLPAGHDQRRRSRFRSSAPCSTRKAIELAWFDHWLKGIDNGAEQARAGQDLRDGRQYLARRAGVAAGPHRVDAVLPALGRRGQHALWRRRAQPDRARRRAARHLRLRSAATRSRRIGGCNCCNPEVVPWGVFDQRPVEVRGDVLVYTTPPLEQDLEVTGPIVVHLFASTDGPDTDFTAKLVDVYPDGKAWNLCDGIVRGRYRKGRGSGRTADAGRGLRVRDRSAG